MVVLFYLVTSIIIPGTPFSWGTALGNLLNLQGICCKSLVSPFWSLSYEVWFYIVLGTLGLALIAKDGYKRVIAFSLFIASASVFVLGLKMHYLLIWMMELWHIWRVRLKEPCIIGQFFHRIFCTLCTLAVL